MQNQKGQIRTSLKHWKAYIKSAVFWWSVLSWLGFYLFHLLGSVTIEILKGLPRLTYGSVVSNVLWVKIITSLDIFIWYDHVHVLYDYCSQLERLKKSFWSYYRTLLHRRTLFCDILLRQYTRLAVNKKGILYISVYNIEWLDRFCCMITSAIVKAVHHLHLMHPFLYVWSTNLFNLMSYMCQLWHITFYISYTICFVLLNSWFHYNWFKNYTHCFGKTNKIFEDFMNYPYK